MVAQTLYCPECDNKYSTLNECPECKIPLSKISNDGIQLINSDNNQVISDVKNSTIIKEHNEYYNSNNETAEYNTRRIRTYPSFWHVIKTRIYLGSGISGVGLFTWLSGTASILSWLGWSVNSINLVEQLVYIALVIIVFVLFIQVSNLFDINTLDYNSYIRHNGITYTKNSDNSINANCIYAKCPVHGCSGHLYLGKPIDNIEGITFSGLCDKKGYLHAFEFNDTSLVGSRIRITPKPRENQ